MQNLLLIAKNEMKDLILDVQTKYKYYNHEIFYSPPIEEKQKNNQNSKYSIQAEIVQINKKNDGNISANKH